MTTLVFTKLIRGELSRGRGSGLPVPFAFLFLLSSLLSSPRFPLVEEESAAGSDGSRTMRSQWWHREGEGASGTSLALGAWARGWPQRCDEL